MDLIIEQKLYGILERLDRYRFVADCPRVRSGDEYQWRVPKGIRYPRWTPERLQQLHQSWTAGAHVGDIATALGTTKKAIQAKVHRLGLEARPKRGRIHGR